jgi:hypothetical protein
MKTLVKGGAESTADVGLGGRKARKRECFGERDRVIAPTTLDQADRWFVGVSFVQPLPGCQPKMAM